MNHQSPAPRTGPDGLGIIPEARCTTAQRSLTGNQLRQAHSLGMITGDQLNNRLDRVQTAVTVAELRRLVSDIKHADIGATAEEREAWWNVTKDVTLITSTSTIPAVLLTLGATVGTGFTHPNLLNISAVVLTIVWVILSIAIVGGATASEVSDAWVLRRARRERARQLTQL